MSFKIDKYVVFCAISLFFVNFLCFGSVCAQSVIDLSQFVGPLPLPVTISNVSATSTVDNSGESVAAILPKAEALKDEFSSLEATIAGIADISGLSAEHASYKARLGKLKTGLVEIKESDSYGFEQVSALRSETRGLVDAVGRHAKYITEKLEKSEALKQSWLVKETNWTSQQKALAVEVSPSLSKVFKEATQTIAAARKRMEGLEVPLVAFQQKVIDLQRETQNFIGEIDGLMSEMRKDLFRKSRPAMFTPTFVFQFNGDLWEEFWLGIASFEMPDRRFFQTYGWVFFLQLFLILGFVYFFRTLRHRNLEQLKLGFLLERYWSASLLLGILFPLPLFDSIPKVLKLILAALISVCAARLVAGVIALPWRRRLMYMLVGLYLLVQFFVFIALPAPAMRLFIAVVGLSAAILCFWRARVNRAEGGSMTFIVGIKLGGAAMALVFLAQAAGYVAFSNHLLDVTIKTVFLGLIAWTISLVLRGLIDALFDNDWSRKNVIVDKHYRVFIKRGNFIVDSLVIFLSFSAVLSVWGFFDSTMLAAERILSFGIAFQGFRISFGLFAWAIVLVYASLFVSWLIQRILDEEVYPRKKVERGVGISINRLIHYAFVVIGVVIGFSTIGIGVQNLTVIVGAFGIGIGFGLQNIVNNFASGLILLFERSIKVGDIVQIRGEWGVIKNLGLRATIVETFDRSEMIVPNSDLVSITVTNWTLSDRQTRLIVPIGVAYGSDVKKVTSILLGIARDNPFIMKFPEPAVLFMNFGASSLDFELRVWVADIDIRLKINNEINYEIDRLFRENAIEIPFAQHDLHIRTMDNPFQEAIKDLGIKMTEPHAADK